ncbi:MAG: preprotein translocase subunit SecG [Rhodobacteraceae bacterium]|jgi:preprotein translocase subunit SecG|nr:preprotein translocase subunit SecG [Paracoccaceae bacterium]
MENVVLIIHLILALCLIGVVLLQRSEGGGLGIGGGGGGAVSARGAATALGKMTWILAILFIGTSIGLTIIAAEKSATGSVVDRLGGRAPASAPASAPVQLPGGESLLPPGADSGSPVTPPRAD